MTIETISIFLLIGAGNWAAHILECPACLAAVGGNVRFLLEGVQRVLGWPADAVLYLLHFFRKPTTGLSVVEVEKRAREAVDRFFDERNKNGNDEVVIRQVEGESDEAFYERAQQIMRDRGRDHAENQRKAPANETRNANGT